MSVARLSAGIRSADDDLQSLQQVERSGHLADAVPKNRHRHFVGGAVMVAIVPNLVNAPELTAFAIILWVALCVSFRCLTVHHGPTCSYCLVILLL
jgi:hypothetical protein